MADSNTGKVRWTDQMVLTAFGLAVAYWIIDGVLYLFTASEISLIQRLFGAEWTGLYSRIIVLCFFAIFGSHAQYNINKRRNVEDELRQLRQQLQAIQSGPMAGQGGK